MEATGWRSGGGESRLEVLEPPSGKEGPEPVQEGRPGARGALGWWGAQLGLNAAWSGLFFGRRRPALAFAELLALQAANLKYARTAAKVDPKAAWLVAPYLGLVGFAGVLNEEIVRRNR
jgi:tryptophan-rich sensory protein